MSKKKRSKAKYTSDGADGTVDRNENVIALTSAPLRDAVGRLKQTPAIWSFVSALRIAANPVEVAMVLETIPLLVDSLTWPEPKDILTEEDSGDGWREVWSLSEIFLIVEPLDPATLKALDGRPPKDPASFRGLLNEEQRAATNKLVDLLVKHSVAHESFKKTVDKVACDLGFKSPYYHAFARWNAMLPDMEIRLGFNPFREADDVMAAFVGARAFGPDEESASVDAASKLSLTVDQRAQLARLWEAACLKCLLGPPPNDRSTLNRGTLVDAKKNFAAPLRLYFPLALAGLGCLLLAGKPIARATRAEAGSKELLDTFFIFVALLERYESMLASPDVLAKIRESATPIGQLDTPGQAATDEKNQAMLHTLMGEYSKSLADNVASLLDPATGECPEPFRSLLSWAGDAADYGLQYFSNIRAPGAVTDAATVLRATLFVAPILPPMLLEAALGPALELNDLENLDGDEYWETVWGLEHVLLTGDRERLAADDGFYDEACLSAEEVGFLETLLSLSRPLSYGPIALAASRLNCDVGLPWKWISHGRDNYDRQLMLAFRAFQGRLIDAESEWGSRAVVSEKALQTAFPVDVLPPPTEPISVRWAIEQVFDEENLDFYNDRLRARNFSRLLSLLLQRGLMSLAGALHCYFVVTQVSRVRQELSRLPKSEIHPDSFDSYFVDDWALFMANTLQVRASDWGDRLNECLHLAADILGSELFGDRFAFEARQLLAFAAVRAPQGDNAAHSADAVLHLAAQSPEYISIETRLLEVMGKPFRDLPDWVREALKYAERLFEQTSADHGMISRHESRPWVLEYAKIVERLLKQQLDVLWTDPVLKTESERLYARMSSARKFPPSFAMNAALDVLAEAARKPGRTVYDRLSRLGVDVTTAATMGPEIRKFVSRARNQEAHASASEQEAKDLRHWVLNNVVSLFSALGRPKS